MAFLWNKGRSAGMDRANALQLLSVAMGSDVEVGAAEDVEVAAALGVAEDKAAELLTLARPGASGEADPEPGTEDDIDTTATQGRWSGGDAEVADEELGDLLEVSGLGPKRAAKLVAGGFGDVATLAAGSLMAVSEAISASKAVAKKLIAAANAVGVAEEAEAVAEELASEAGAEAAAAAEESAAETAAHAAVRNVSRAEKEAPERGAAARAASSGVVRARRHTQQVEIRAPGVLRARDAAKAKAAKRIGQAASLPDSEIRKADADAGARALVTEAISDVRQAEGEEATDGPEARRAAFMQSYHASEARPSTLEEFGWVREFLSGK